MEVILLSRIMAMLLSLSLFVVSVLTDRPWAGKIEKRAPVSCLFYISSILSIFYTYLLLKNSSLDIDTILDIRLSLYVVLHVLVFIFTSLTFGYDLYITFCIALLVLIAHVCTVLDIPFVLKVVVYSLFIINAVFKTVSYCNIYTSYTSRIRGMILFLSVIFFIIFLIPQDGDIQRSAKEISFMLHDIYLLGFCSTLFLYPYEQYIYDTCQTLNITQINKEHQLYF